MSNFMPLIECDEIVTIEFDNDTARITIKNINGEYTLNAPSEELRDFLNEFIEANNE